MTRNDAVRNPAVRTSIPGNKRNFYAEADVLVYTDGCVRLQQSSDPIDIILLTPNQLRKIVGLAAPYTRRV